MKTLTASTQSAAKLEALSEKVSNLQSKIQQLREAKDILQTRLESSKNELEKFAAR
jgi:outer membrane murein-binding lipoprotein Lpp